MNNSKLNLSNVPTIGTGPIMAEPLSDFIIVEEIPHTHTTGGIALPDGASPEPPKARVIKCGPGHRDSVSNLIPMPVKPGDVVYLMTINGQGINVTFGGKKYGLVRSRDLIMYESADPVAASNSKLAAQSCSP